MYTFKWSVYLQSGIQKLAVNRRTDNTMPREKGQTIATKEENCKNGKLEKWKINVNVIFMSESKEKRVYL